MSSAPPPLAFLYEDDALVVVDKPAGSPVIAASGWPAGASIQARAATQLGARLWVVHRLDRETSGALAFARTAAAHRALSLAFERRDVHKTYRALVMGVPMPAEGTITVAMHPARKGKSRPARAGESGVRDAVTGYRVIRTWRRSAERVALVELSPRTGRHHQIRVHLRAIGTPILADPVYGRSSMIPPSVAPLTRLALHATEIDLPHPADGRRVRAAAPWPADLERLIARLDCEWAAEGVD